MNDDACMTWRQLAQEIMALPECVLDTKANVWIPLDWRRPFQGDEFVDVNGITPFDGELLPDESNAPSISIDER